VLIAAVPALGTWIGRLYGKEAARERELREKAERYAEELAERQRQVEQLAAELTASRRRILAVGDQMRRRIERDLHDGAQQRLVSLSLMLRGIRDRAPADVRADVDEVCDGLASALQELRDLSRGLHPAILSEAGLGPAVRALARHSPLPVRVQVRADGRLPGSCEATAYYVAAEAFTNAAKHAAASAVDILIERADGELTVQVRDDGVGGADATRGSGLVGLRDRVEAVGGTMTLDSPARAGTVLTVRLPVTTEDHLSERAVAHGPATCEPTEGCVLAEHRDRGLRRCRPLHDGTQQRLVSLGLELRLARGPWCPLGWLTCRQRSTGSRTSSTGWWRTCARSPGASTRRSCPRVAWGRPCGRWADGPRSRSSSMSPRSGGCRSRSRWRRITGADDGAGGADPLRGSGLVGLKDRIEALGGTFSVYSPAGGGTTVSCELPVVTGTALPSAL